MVAAASALGSPPGVGKNTRDPWVTPRVLPFLSSWEEGGMAAPGPPPPPRGEARSPHSARSPESPAPAPTSILDPTPGAGWLDLLFLAPFPPMPTPLRPFPDPSLCFLDRHSARTPSRSLELLEAAGSPRDQRGEPAARQEALAGPLEAGGAMFLPALPASGEAEPTGARWASELDLAQLPGQAEVRGGAPPRRHTHAQPHRGTRSPRQLVALCKTQAHKNIIWMIKS